MKIDIFAGNRKFPNIFVGFFYHNVDYVIDRNNSHQMILLVYNRDRKQIIFLEDAGHFFLIHMGRYRNNTLIH